MMATPARDTRPTLASRMDRARTPEKKLRLLVRFAYSGTGDEVKQPCIFRTIGDEVELHVNRQSAYNASLRADQPVILECGQALFRLRLAMQAFGFSPQVRTFPDLLDADLLALIRIGARVCPDAETERLFAALTSEAAKKRTQGAEISASMEVFRSAASREGAHLVTTDVSEVDSSGSTRFIITTNRDLTPDHLVAGQALARLRLTALDLGLDLVEEPAKILDPVWRGDVFEHHGTWPQAVLTVSGFTPE